MSRSTQIFLWLMAAGAGTLAIAFGGLLWRAIDSDPDRVLPYTEVDGVPLALDVFLPRGERPARGYPALLLFHGGGWRHGGPWQFHPQCRAFSRAGIACFSAQYRTASRFASSPRDAVADATEAWRYLWQQAERLDIDPDRLFVGGGSAGGHLAAMLGGDRVTAGQRPAALILYNPLLNLAPGYYAHERFRSDWAAMSPHHRLEAPAPDALIMSGTADVEVLVPTLQQFCQRLEQRDDADALAREQLGGRCTLELFAGAEHGFFNPGSGSGDDFQRTNRLVIDYVLGHGG